MKARLTFNNKEDFDKIRVLADNQSLANYPYHGHREIADWEKHVLVVVGTPSAVEHFLFFELHKVGINFSHTTEKGY